MKTFDLVCLWAKQIVLDINITINNIIDFLFSPLYTFVDMVQTTIHQWTTNPTDEEPENKPKRIGFNNK